MIPVSSFSVDQNSYCPGSIIYFNVNGSDPIKKYSWDFGDNAFDSVMSPAHSYAASGSYSVSLIVENYCGKKDTSYKTITINSTSLANADFTTVAGFAACIGTAVQFKNMSSDTANVKWYFGDGDTSMIANPTHTFISPGNYYVQLLVQNACGSSSSNISKLIRVSSRYSPVASINIADSSVFCITSPIYLEAKSPSVNSAFSWDFGDGTGSTIYNPVKTFNAAGYYTIRLDASNFCGTKSDSTVIHIIDTLMTPALTCSLVSNAIIFSWDSVPYAGSYEININSGGWQTLPSYPRSFQTAANAGDSISAVIRALGLSGCSSNVSLSSSCVYTGIKEGRNENSFQISPNPFTGDLAIRFDKYPDAYELRIYNEFSQKVFEITIENKMNLTINLSFLPPGLYMVNILNLKQLTSFSKKIIKY
jgi:PKD repeat protein